MENVKDCQGKVTKLLGRITFEKMVYCIVMFWGQHHTHTCDLPFISLYYERNNVNR